ncbi:MAG: hypothetical protein ACKPB7_33350, partial [Sphaerospermopsis kisseleviana]
RKALLKQKKQRHLLRFDLNTFRLSPKQRNNVGWVERSETQQTPVNVGFCSSTQPCILEEGGLGVY